MTRAYMSFGAGVQSTAIAMLAINRDLDLRQPTNPQQRLWDNECAGVCGV